MYRTTLPQKGLSVRGAVFTTTHRQYPVFMFHETGARGFPVQLIYSRDGVRTTCLVYFFTLHSNS